MICTENPMFLQCVDAVVWVIYPLKPVPDMICNVFCGTLNLIQRGKETMKTLVLRILTPSTTVDGN